MTVAIACLVSGDIVPMLEQYWLYIEREREGRRELKQPITQSSRVINSETYSFIVWCIEDIM